VEALVLAVGRLRPYYREAYDDYIRRIGKYLKVRDAEVREASRAPTEDAQRAEEAERLRRHLRPGTTVVALARAGDAWSSEQLARRLEGWRMEARPLAFVIGGSRGLAPDLVTSAAHHWSLGPLTLPHELARVVVAEQLYRGMTILRGEPYHKGS
jgi:23S rRNA (pseudouridine1915-N3)-methyltransferase